MRWHEFKRQINLRWRRRWIRLSVSILIILFVTVLQYYITRIPEPIAVEANGQYTPAQSKAQSETLIIQGPRIASNDYPLLSFDGSENEIFEFHAEVAQLSSDTFDFFQELVKSNVPPSSFEPIDYFVENENQDEGTNRIRRIEGVNGPDASILNQTCKMYMRAYPIDVVPTEIRFYKPEHAKAHFQPVVISFEGADVAIHIKQHNPERNDGDEPWGMGCKKKLQIKDWSISNRGQFDLMLIVKAGSAVRVDFSTTSRSVQFEKSFEPFKLGEGSLKAMGITVLKNDAPSMSQIRPFEVTATQNQGALSLSRLVSTADTLELSFSGVGVIKTNGKSAKTLGLLHMINEFPLVAGIFGIVNTALLGWLVHNLRKTQ